jgi:hypothetical protein
MKLILSLAPNTEYNVGDIVDTGGEGFHLWRVFRAGKTDDLVLFRTNRHLIENIARMWHFHESWECGTVTFMMAHKADHEEADWAMYWKRRYCAAITVGKHNQMLQTGFFDGMPPEMRTHEIAHSKRILEEIYTEFPALREWMAI